MAEGNHLCETQNCANAATAFGLKGTLKTRSCDLHIASLVAKKMTVHSIDGYDFISNPQDSALFDERKTVIEKGMSNLALLEANIDEEYRASLRLLESEKSKLLNTVEAIFLKIEETVTKRCKELKEQILPLAVSFHGYVKCRENALNSTAELLCGEVKAFPSSIDLAIEGVSNPVSRAINQYWSVSACSIESLLKIAVSVFSQPVTVESAVEYSQKGINYYNSKQWKEAEENYLQAKAIYEKCAPLSADAATNLDDLGLLYKDSKRFNEADVNHRMSQAIFERIDPQCEEAARNHTNYGLLCIDLNRLNEAEQHFQVSKRISETAGKHTQTLAYALRGLGQIRSDQKRYSEAAEFFRQAQPIYEATIPQSVNAAYNYFLLGNSCYSLKLYKEAEVSYLRAKRIYETIDSQSANFAACLNNLGLVYEAQERFEDSISLLQSAVQQYALINDSQMKSNSENHILRVQAKRSKK